MIDWTDINSTIATPNKNYTENIRLLYLSPNSKIKTPAYYLFPERIAKAVVVSFNEVLGAKSDKERLMCALEKAKPVCHSYFGLYINSKWPWGKCHILRAS